MPSAPLLRAIEWALSIKAELRPQGIAEWKAALDAQLQAKHDPRDDAQEFGGGAQAAHQVAR